MLDVLVQLRLGISVQCCTRKQSCSNYGAQQAASTMMYPMRFTRVTATSTAVHSFDQTHAQFRRLRHSAARLSHPLYLQFTLQQHSTAQGTHTTHAAHAMAGLQQRMSLVQGHATAFLLSSPLFQQASLTGIVAAEQQAAYFVSLSTDAGSPHIASSSGGRSTAAAAAAGTVTKCFTLDSVTAQTPDGGGAQQWFCLG